MKNIDAKYKKILKKYAFGDFLSGNQQDSDNPYSGTAKETKLGLHGLTAYNPIIGMAAQIGEGMLAGQESKMKSFDIETGEFNNEKQAQHANLLRSMWDPGTTMARTFNDPKSTTREKIGSVANFFIPGSGFGLIGNKRRLQHEKDYNEEASEDYNKVINKQKLSNLQANFNNQEARNTIGTNRFAEGGDLTRPADNNRRILPKSATSVGEMPKNDKLVIPYNRAKSLYQAQLFGTAEQPFVPYKYAVEKGLTPTTQNFMYDRHNTTDPYEASIKETERMGGKEFFDVRNNQISNLVPTQDIPLDRAQKANKFMVDLQNRGYIKYASGGVLNYTGQTHEGPDGGIEVDQNGNPSQSVNNESVGMVEAGESSWKRPKTGKVYIFSNRISYK